MGKKVTIYLVRHGETYLNLYKRMQGWADTPLTEEGKVVAIETGKKLSHTHFDRVITSDLGRTVETAEYILSETAVNKELVIQKLKAFRESFFGSFEGELAEVAWKKVSSEHGYESFETMAKICSPGQVMDYMKESDPFHHAENFSETWERIEQGLYELVQSSDKEDETILLVTHGNTIRNIIHQFDKEIDVIVNIKNSSVSVLEFYDGNFHVISFNQ